MPQVFIALGSNLGNRKRNLDRASRALGREGLRGIRRSPIYETQPVGGPRQRNYLNAVLEANTRLSPEKLIQRLLNIEKKLGRVRKKKNEPRVIDLDLLFYEKRIVVNVGARSPRPVEGGPPLASLTKGGETPPLQIPHPRLHKRWFVLKPLSDLASDFKHPVLRKTVRQMLGDLTVGAIHELPLHPK